MSKIERKFDKFFVANLRRTAQMVSPMVREKDKLIAEIEEKYARVDALRAQIESLDSHIRQECGYGVEDLITREVVNTGKFDKTGKPVKVTKWILKYPETIIPPTEEPNLLSCEEQKTPDVSEENFGDEICPETENFVETENLIK